MKIEDVAIAQIDFDDETFRISEDLEPPSLRSSLKAVGQINPVILLPGEGAMYAIVCGFRRLTLLRQSGAEQAKACIQPYCSGAILQGYHIAMWDNLSHRQLSPLEKARILRGLRTTCQVAPAVLVERYLPALGLSPHENVLHGYLSLNTLHPSLKSMLNREYMPLFGAIRLADYSLEDQAAFAVLLAKVRFSASLLRQSLDLAEEVRARTGCTPAELLDQPAMQAILADDRMSSFQKGEAVHAHLFQQSHPRLCRAREHYAQEKAKLNLSGRIHLTPDPYFETARLKVEYEVSSPQEFREAAAALDRAGRNPSLDALFDIE